MGREANYGGSIESEKYRNIVNLVYSAATAPHRLIIKAFSFSRVFFFTKSSTGGHFTTEFMIT